MVNAIGSWADWQGKRVYVVRRTGVHSGGGPSKAARLSQVWKEIMQTCMSGKQIDAVSHVDEALPGLSGMKYDLPLRGLG